jgi:Ca2+-binding RTX toxin-like protein
VKILQSITSTIATELDFVQSSLTYTLGSNLENPTLTGPSAVNGTGNPLNNTITGNGADNYLSSGAGNDSLIGGAGNDTMTGGADSDRFIYDTNAAFTTTGGGILNCL